MAIINIQRAYDIIAILKSTGMCPQETWESSFKEYHISELRNWLGIGSMYCFSFGHVERTLLYLEAVTLEKKKLNFISSSLEWG